MILRPLATLALLACPALAFAQAAAPPSDVWSVGVAAVAIDSPYAGEGTRVRPVPLLRYEGERLFFEGASGGVHLVESGGFSLDALLSARLDGFDIDDLGRAELLANGVDADLLRDRDDGLDAGLRASFGADWGAVSLEGLHDISGASEGYEIALDYRYTWQFQGAALTASAGASWLSADLAGYYFGTLDEEVARGVVAYAPGSTVLPRTGLTLSRPIGATRWVLLGAVEYQFLSSELRDSPLLDPDRNGAARVVLGLSRRF
ncbi:MULTISPECIES: MipA/OmpV family protein [Luteimonas]|uniref:MipA/OmpV family protein n=1 Tax=Luteimonas TaxID=83614 RepID=UPI000C7BDE45|nr:MULTISPECIES: MipA/OmpV family protein [Luteimonas]